MLLPRTSLQHSHLDFPGVLVLQEWDWGVESRESSGGGNAFSIRECTENFGVQEATYRNAEDLS